MAETPFKLKSGNTPLFKQMGGTPVKHIRSEEKRAGHNKKYHQTDPSNKAHGEYWTPDKDTGKTPKQEEIEATATGTTEGEGEGKVEGGGEEVTPKKKKGNWLTRTLKRFDDEVQSRMKTPRSDWDKEGYESERKARYATTDAGPTKMKGSPAKDKKEYGPYSYHHNTQKATKEHHGDPHGPAPNKMKGSPAKDMPNIPNGMPKSTVDELNAEHVKKEHPHDLDTPAPTKDMKTGKYKQKFEK